MERVWYVLASLLGVAGVITLTLWFHEHNAGAEVPPALLPLGVAELLLTCGCGWVVESRYD